MRLKKFCIPLQSAILSHVIQHWKNRLEEEFDVLSRFLYPTDESAISYPKNLWVYYRIVVYPDGKVLGVNDEDVTDRIHLTQADIIKHKFDLKMFRREMCETFGLKPSTDEIGKIIHGVPWGTWEPEKGIAFPVTMLFVGSDFRGQVLERILNRKAAGEILITPTRLEWKNNLEEIARENKILLVPLNEIVQMEDGKLMLTPEWTEYLTAFCKMVEMDLPSMLREKPEGNLFAKRGEWTLRFAGKNVVLNGELQGPAFVKRLMMTPHEEVHVEQLWKEVFGNGQRKITQVEGGQGKEWNSFLSSGDEILDATGKADYRNRLLQLNSDRTEAESENDIAWLERINTETEAISARLLKTVDGKGHSRKIGDEKDKLRKRISKNITKAIAIIGDTHLELAEHLKSFITMGEYMAYRPSEKIEWSFE